MVSKIRGTNTFVHNNFEIDFQIKSRKNGQSIKDNDYILFGENRIQKKLGLIGCNASGKTSALEKISLFNSLWNYHTIWNSLANSVILEWERTNFDNANGLKIIKNRPTLINANNFFKIINVVAKDANFLLDQMKIWVNHFYNISSFDKFAEKLSVEIDYYVDGVLYTNMAELYKTGYLRLVTKNKNKIIFEKNINLISLEIEMKFNLDPKFNINFIRPNFNDPILDNRHNLFMINQSIILQDTYNYISKFNKQSHFVKWLKIADKSINNLVMDSKNQIFHLTTTKNITLDLFSLSLGTRKWIILYHALFIIKKIVNNENSNLIILDEIENSFHYKLINLIFSVIDNTDKMQLLFTAHNPYIFDEFYRHDGIYLTKYDNEQYSLTRLDNLKMRKDIVIYSQYLKEFIGNHPDSQNILNFLDENDKW